jgi:tetratricopeptide (TPR) repeat protein
MKKLALLLAVSVWLVSLAPVATAASDDANLGFESAFPRKFYEKKYFGLAVTGAMIVAAGTFTYFTAGAGAPAAATGVSTVASWVAGGGAGSYMAGLSTIGGWFGGNAILGAAILNGISLGTVGGMGTWSTLSAGQKVLALSATAATAMDGIAIIAKPGTGQLEWRVMLPVPRALADDRIRQLVDALSETNRALESLGSRVDAATKELSKQAAGGATTQELNKAQQELAAAAGRHKEISRQVEAEVNRALKSGETNGNTVVLAVLAHNSGRSAEFRTLLGRIKPGPLERRSYLDYLRAIAALQTGKIAEAEQLLYGTLKVANFAIEPSVLLASILGSRGYAAQESTIEEVARYADKNFDADAYMPVASLVSLHYRIGTMALGAKRCDRALDEFRKAQSSLSMIEKYWKAKDIRNLLDVGEANALYCQNKTVDAFALFKKVASRATSKDAHELLCMQFSGGCEGR